MSKCVNCVDRFNCTEEGCDKRTGQDDVVQARQIKFEAVNLLEQAYRRLVVATNYARYGKVKDLPKLTNALQQMSHTLKTLNDVQFEVKHEQVD